MLELLDEQPGDPEGVVVCLLTLVFLHSWTQSRPHYRNSLPAFLNLGMSPRHLIAYSLRLIYLTDVVYTGTPRWAKLKPNAKTGFDGIASTFAGLAAILRPEGRRDASTLR